MAKKKQSKPRVIVAADVGGTRARFVLLDETGAATHAEKVLDSRAFATFEDALAEFLNMARSSLGERAVKKIAAASFGIAGPVVKQRVKTTNLPWVIDGEVVADRFGIGRVTLLNDLVAVGFGALASPPSKIKVVHRGKPKREGGNVAVIAAGTGLGEAAFVWDGAHHVPLATEGSHVDFAPRTSEEAALAANLAERYGHVSYERIASGSTIGDIYNFFVHDCGVRESAKAAGIVEKAADRNVAVIDLAESQQSEAARRAMDLWMSVYGAEAGNLALKTLATAGVFVCGGVSARLARALREGIRPSAPAAVSPFVAAFLDKGRMRPLLERVPVAVCIDPLVGLRGAASHASQVALGR